MPWFRFSIVQLMLLTMLVGIGAGAFVAVRQQGNLWEIKQPHFFRDNRRLVLHSPLRPNQLEIWDLRSQPARWSTLDCSQFLPAQHHINSLAPLDGNLVLLSTYGAASAQQLIVDVETEEVVQQRTTPYYFTALTPDARTFIHLVTTGPTGLAWDVQIVRAADQTVLAKIPLDYMQGDLPHTLAISSDGQRVMWATKDRQIRQAIAQETAPPTYTFSLESATKPTAADPPAMSQQPYWHPMSIHADTGRLAGLDMEGGVVVVDPRGKELCRLPNVDSGREFQWSRNGSRISCWSMDSVTVVDVKSGKVLLALDFDGLSRGLPDMGAVPPQPALSHDGALLALASRDQVAIWDVDSASQTLVLNPSNRWQNFLVYWAAITSWAALWGWERKVRVKAELARRGRTPLGGLDFGRHRWRTSIGFLTGMALILAMLVLAGFDYAGGWSWLPLGIGVSFSGVAVLLVIAVAMTSIYWRRWKGRNALVEDEKSRLKAFSRRIFQEQRMGQIDLVTVGRCELGTLMRGCIPKAEAWADDFFRTPARPDHTTLFLFERYDDFEAHLGNATYRPLAVRVHQTCLSWFICEEFLRKGAVPLNIFAEMLITQFVARRYHRDALPPWLIGVHGYLALFDLRQDVSRKIPRIIQGMRSRLKPGDDLWSLLVDKVHPAVQEAGPRLITHPHEHPLLEHEQLNEQYDQLMCTLAAWLWESRSLLPEGTSQEGPARQAGPASPGRFACWRGMIRELLAKETLAESDFSAAVAAALGCTLPELGRRWCDWVLAQPPYRGGDLEPQTIEALKQHVIPALQDRRLSDEHTILAIRAAASRGSLLTVPALIGLLRTRSQFNPWTIWALTQALGQSHGDDPAAWQQAYERTWEGEAPAEPEVVAVGVPPFGGVEEMPAKAGTPTTPPAALRWYWGLLILGGCVTLGFVTAITFYLAAFVLPVVLALILVAPTGIRQVAAGIGQRTGKEIDDLRTRQAWSILYGDVVNVLLAWIESRLANRPEVNEYRLRPDLASD